MKNLIWIVSLFFGLTSSLPSEASYQQGHSVATGGDGFHLTKTWGGSPGSQFQIEYYGALSEQCRASQSSGSQSRITFFVRVNGRLVVSTETSCGEYRGSDGRSHTYAILELSSDDGRAEFVHGKQVPWLFYELDMSSKLHVEIWIQSVTGEWDSRGGQNYHFDL